RLSSGVVWRQVRTDGDCGPMAVRPDVCGTDDDCGLAAVRADGIAPRQRRGPAAAAGWRSLRLTTARPEGGAI
ncbi:hypothetical protein ACFWZ2_18520, partial [Streptomyces sp. NPDC059002]|uniref:hypothetical protein n=1 Tax=Streptomyces sp. NPDC059002 TaxID=3346690 RepID=UPI0036B04E1D